LRHLRAVTRVAAALFLLCAGAHAEEIRIQVARGLASARVEHDGRAQIVRPTEAPLTFSGPVKLDGQKLPGTLELYAEGGRLLAVNVVDLERYVAAVVSSEVPRSWPVEALKAQAVAARTFAVAQKVASGAGARAHLGASVLDQVYRNAADPPVSALDAARATGGEVLTWGAAPIAAYFSASCGGRSESAEAAFRLTPGSTPYLRGGDADDDDRSWMVRIPMAEISAALRRAGRMRAEVFSVELQSRTPSGRAGMLLLNHSKLAAVELRQILGYRRLPSLLFDVETDGKEAVFRGRGSGHGVGLCQTGAKNRAEAGASYREILAHYYPGAEIRRMY
jgi:stage II sporulation protein D